MHCPNCGTKASNAQKFCRTCGFGLKKVEQLVTEQKAAVTDQSMEAAGNHSNDRLSKFEKWGWRALGALGAILGSIMLWGIIGKIMIEKGQIFQGSIILMTLAAIVLYIPLIYRYYERKESASTRSNPKQRLPQAPEAMDTTKMPPEPNAEIVASVAEHTTAKLEEKALR